ncbi:Two-component sensor histidine kinase [Staphylococcus aureus]|uniref:histidine kinase n=1 Tax=Staphylococcus aureus TaxID=1280 RepID=A0A380DPE0_STAAU|nr:Two-component sensor histidine kinase [Staphylococcus aureus]
MIEQLINNALKYARGKDIWIEFDEQSNQLYVKDNGIGISEADLPKIFDKGYSGYNGQRQSNSSGIGLFIENKFQLTQTILFQSYLNKMRVQHLRFNFQMNKNFQYCKHTSNIFSLI